MTPLSAVGLCCVLVARKYTLKRNVIKSGERPASAGTTEGEQNTRTVKEEQKIESEVSDVVTTGENSTAKTEETQ